MIVEELTNRISFRTAGLGELRKAAKALDEIKKRVKDFERAAKGSLGAGMARDANRLAQALKAVGSAARKAQADFGKSPGGRSWVQDEINRLRQLQRLQGQVSGGGRGGGRRAASAGALPRGPSLPTASPDTRRAATFTGRASGSSARESFRQQQAGMSPAEVATLRKRSIEISGDNPSIDTTTIREMGRAARNMLPSFEAAMEILPDLAKALVALQSAKGIEKGGGELEDFLKSLDVGGRTEDVGSIRALLQGAIKATSVEGRQLPLREFLLAQKYSKSAGAGLSPEFLTSIAPTFMQDLGGQRFGTQLGSMLSQLVGERGTSRTMAKRTQMGLQTDSGVIGRDLLLSNPYEWAQQYLKPALERDGVNLGNEGSIAAALAKTFSNQMVADLFTKMITQSPQVERNKKLYAGAMGLEASDEARRKDPYVALEGVYGAARNLASVATEGHVEKATATLNGLADAISAFTKRLADDPNSANIVGTAGLAGGVAAVGAAGWWTARGPLRWLLNLLGPKGQVAEAAGAAAEKAAEAAGKGGRAASAGAEAARKVGGSVPSVTSSAGAEAAAAAAKPAGFMSRALGAIGRVAGPLAPLMMLRDLGEAHNPMTPTKQRMGQEIDEAVWERARRAVEEFKKNPEGVRGRALMNLKSGAALDTMNNGAEAAKSAAGGSQIENNISAPITSTATFNGIFDETAARKVQAMIDASIAQLPAKLKAAGDVLGARSTKASNTSTGSITAP